MRLIPRDEQFYTMFSDLATRIATRPRLSIFVCSGARYASSIKLWVWRVT